MNNPRRVTGLLAGVLVAVSLLGPAWPAAAAVRARGAAPAGLSAGEWQSIVAQIRERPYRLEPAAGGGYRAANPAQGWTVAFDADGAGIRPAADDWTWSLRLLSYGYPGAERSVNAPPRLTAAGARVDYAWGEGLTEWWRNGPDGLKQTFVLTERPAAPETVGPLAITVRVGGSEEVGDGRLARVVHADRDPERRPRAWPSPATPWSSGRLARPARPPG